MSFNNPQQKQPGGAQQQQQPSPNPAQGAPQEASAESLEQGLEAYFQAQEDYMQKQQEFLQQQQAQQQQFRNQQAATQQGPTTGPAGPQQPVSGQPQPGPHQQAGPKGQPTFAASMEAQRKEALRVFKEAQEAYKANLKDSYEATVEAVQQMYNSVAKETEAAQKEMSGEAQINAAQGQQDANNPAYTASFAQAVQQADERLQQQMQQQDQQLQQARQTVQGAAARVEEAEVVNNQPDPNVTPPAQ